MKKEEREKKVKFIEILLTVGSLLGTALTLTLPKIDKTQIWALSLVSLLLFIFFSIRYYRHIMYESLENVRDRYRFKILSALVAFFFSLLFATIIVVPIVNSLNSIDLTSLAYLLVPGYFILISQEVYNVLTRSLIVKTKKEDNVNQKGQIERKIGKKFIDYFGNLYVAIFLVTIFAFITFHFLPELGKKVVFIILVFYISDILFASVKLGNKSQKKGHAFIIFYLMIIFSTLFSEWLSDISLKCIISPHLGNEGYDLFLGFGLTLLVCFLFYLKYYRRSIRQFFQEAK